MVEGGLAVKGNNGNVVTERKPVALKRPEERKRGLELIGKQ
jgi:hypothetical protein